MKKKNKSQPDVSVTAFEILQAVTGEPAGDSHNGNTTKKKDIPEKNPAAVALGRLGGLKGGKARANSLTKEKRRDIALKAAKTRWKHPKQASQ